MLRPMAYTGGTPHNTLNFTRVEHLYKPCRSTSVWPTSCRLLNKSNQSYYR